LGYVRKADRLIVNKAVAGGGEGMQRGSKKGKKGKKNSCRGAAFDRCKK